MFGGKARSGRGRIYNFSMGVSFKKTISRRDAERAEVLRQEDFTFESAWRALRACSLLSPVRHPNPTPRRSLCVRTLSLRTCVRFFLAQAQKAAAFQRRLRFGRNSRVGSFVHHQRYASQIIILETRNNYFKPLKRLSYPVRSRNRLTPISTPCALKSKFTVVVCS